MSLKDLSFPISDLSWDHYWVVQEELGISETQAETILTKVLSCCELHSKIAIFCVLICPVIL